MQCAPRSRLIMATICLVCDCESIRRESHAGIGAYGSEDYFDMAFDESVDTRVPCGVSR